MADPSNRTNPAAPPTPTSPTRITSDAGEMTSVARFPDDFLVTPRQSTRAPVSGALHPSIGVLTCMTPLTTDTVNGDGPFQPTPDVLAVGELLSSMKTMVDSLDTTFTILGDQTGKINELAPALEITRQMDIIKRQMAEQYRIQGLQMDKAKEDVRQKIKTLIANDLQQSVKNMVQESVQKEIKDHVRVQLNKQIPMPLRQQVKSHKRQILEITTSLHNSEARRHNSLLISASLQEPLRPLLRPFPIQSPSPAPSTLLAPNITVTPPADSPFSPTVPSVPAQTPVGTNTSAQTEDVLPAEPPTASPHFPPTLAKLFALKADDARALAKEYGLAAGGTDQRPPLSPLKEEQDQGTKKDDNAESDIDRFLAHIGVPVRMIQVGRNHAIPVPLS